MVGWVSLVCVRVVGVRKVWWTCSLKRFSFGCSRDMFILLSFLWVVRGFRYSDGGRVLYAIFLSCFIGERIFFIY